MSAISTLGMNPARRKIEEAAIAYQAARDAEIKARRQALAEAERRHSEEALATFLAAMPAAATVASKQSRPKAIIRAVADKHGIEPADITGLCRSARFVAARHEAVWAVKNATSLSLPEIGRHFKRDHSTIWHSIRRHQARLDAEAAAQSGGAVS